MRSSPRCEPQREISVTRSRFVSATMELEFPAEIREKIFNPFFTTKPAGEGTGLGLSMSHDIVVKQHGGTIDLMTEPGGFTEFIITLPRSVPG